MTAIAQSNLTFTKVDEDFLSVANKIVIWDITFGNGALTYPSGGIPVATSVGTLGFNKTIKFAQISQPAGSGYHYRWSLSDTAPKIRIYQTPGESVANHIHTLASHIHTISVTSAGGSAVDTYDELSALGIVFASGNALQRTKTGAAATLSTGGTSTLSTGTGGAETATPAAMSEVTTAYAPASTTVRVMLIGE